MGKVLEFLKSPTVRRLLVFLVSFGTVALNKRFGLNLDADELVTEAVLALGYIGQSAFTDASKSRSDAMVQAASMAVPPVVAPSSADLPPDAKPTPNLRGP